MNRRGFLALLAGGAAGLVLDPERLLWVPGRKTIFLPPTQTFVTADWVAREALRVLHQQLTFVQFVNRTYDARVGQTIRIPLNGKETRC